MYWNPFDLAHSGQIETRGGWVAILGFTLGQSLVGCGIFLFEALVAALACKGQYLGRTITVVFCNSLIPKVSLTVS
jgi:hypothetical protein